MKSPTRTTAMRQRFIEDMQLRHFSPATQRAYVHYVAGYALHYDRSPDELDLGAVRQYQLHLLNERRLSPQSVNCFVSAVQFLYLNTLGMPWKPEDFVRARVEHKLPVVPGLAEIRTFFENIPGVKNRMALMLCYGAGLRVSEAVAVKTEHIDSARMLIRVEQGKGAKDRYTCLSPGLLKMLRAYFRMVRPPRPWLFPSVRPQRHITGALLQRACTEACQTAGLTKRITPHSLRHAFASCLLDEGVDTRVIQVLLGHTRIDTTAHYTTVSPSKIASTFSPADQLLARPRRPGRPRKA